MKRSICYPVKETLVSSPCLNRWEILERMGEEANYGEIWAACCEKDCEYVLKYLPYENDNSKENILNEINIQNECAELGLCPKIKDAWLCEEGGAIVMNSLDMTVANLFLKYKSDVVRQMILANIIVLLEKLHIHGIYHGDLHLNNIMVKGKRRKSKNEEEEYNLKEYKYYFIDFGKSGKFERMDDFHIYRDYDNILGHLLDLVDENPKDEGLHNIVKTMKVHIKKFE